MNIPWVQFECYWKNVTYFQFRSGAACVTPRAGLTIGQTGQMPRASRFWGPRAWIPKHSFTGFSYFRLFTTRQNCRGFWLLRLAYRPGKLLTLAFIVFEWLKRIEPNSGALYDPRTISKSVHPVDVRRHFSWAGQRPSFVYPLQVADDAMQMEVHKMLDSFYRLSLCWLNLNSQSFVWNVFYTSAIRNAFLFTNYLISIFSSTFCK